MANYCQNNNNDSTLENPVLRIYWPLDVLSITAKERSGEPSIVIGWRNGEEDLVVVTTLPFMDPSIVDNLLTKDVLLAEYPLSAPQVYSICGVKRLSVLGTVNYKQFLDTNRPTSSSHDPAHYQPAFSKFIPHSSFFNVALGGDQGTIYPVLDHSEKNRHPLNCPSFFKIFKYQQTQMIMFDPPIASRMQYYSLEPISLELSEKSSFTIISQEYEKSLLDEQKEKEQIIEKVKLHASYDPAELSYRGLILRNTISQINCCHELGVEMRRKALEVYPRIRIQTRLRRRLSVSEFAIESAKHVHNRVIDFASNCWDRVVPLLMVGFLGMLMCLRVIAEGILRVIEYRAKPSFYTLKDVSATALQIDLRLQQFCYWPIQYLKIYRRSRDWSSNTNFNMEYIRFYNNIWLVLNDVIIGITLSNLMLERKERIVEYLCYAIDTIFTIEFERTILWLMDWPGGLKLNTELALFFGELILWVIQFWGNFLNLFRPYFGVMVTIVAYSGFAGATLLISVVSDLASFFPAHVYAFYLASGRIYNWQLTVLRSLFHLFRGKKRNILRNRVDSCNYELDQLLIGTILFMSLIFLLPTVVVFYLTFAFFRFAVIIVNAVLESCLACLNHFPLFAILLRIKDFKRVPGGIVYKVLPSPTDSSTSLILLQPLPLQFGKMFYQFTLLTTRLRLHYLSFSVVLRLLSGQFVPIQRSKLYTLLYSKLPARRVNIHDLYKELFPSSSTKQESYDFVSSSGPGGVGNGSRSILAAMINSSNNSSSSSNSNVSNQPIEPLATATSTSLASGVHNGYSNMANTAAATTSRTRHFQR